MTKTNKDQEQSPPKPTDVEVRLVGVGLIEKIDIGYTLTSADEANEWVRFNGKHKFPWSAWDLLEVSPSFPRSIARVRPAIEKKVIDYKRWLTSEKRDLATYRRLQRKFGPQITQEQ